MCQGRCLQRRSRLHLGCAPEGAFLAASGRRRRGPSTGRTGRNVCSPGRRIHAVWRGTARGTSSGRAPPAPFVPPRPPHRHRPRPCPWRAGWLLWVSAPPAPRRRRSLSPRAPLPPRYCRRPRASCWAAAAAAARIVGRPCPTCKLQTHHSRCTLATQSAAHQLVDSRGAGEGPQSNMTRGPRCATAYVVRSPYPHRLPDPITTPAAVASRVWAARGVIAHHAPHSKRVSARHVRHAVATIV